MGRIRQRNRNISKLNILHILIICIFTCLIVFTCREYLSLRKQVKTLSDKLKQTENQIEIANNTINDYKAKLQESKEAIEKVNSKRDECLTNIRSLEDKILKGESNKKIAYITIDDGPYDKTYDFLKLLNDYDATATFFVLLKPSREKIYKDILANGNSLGNHTASHKFGKDGIYRSTEAFLEDFHSLQTYLTDTIKYSPNLYRFPGGSPTAGKFKLEIVNKLKDEGMSYVDWNVLVGDGSEAMLKQKRPYEWFKEQMNGKRIAVILMHDYSQPTLEDFPKMLQYLKDNEYLILPLSNKSVMVN